MDPGERQDRLDGPNQALAQMRRNIDIMRANIQAAVPPNYQLVRPGNVQPPVHPGNVQPPVNAGFVQPPVHPPPIALPMGGPHHVPIVRAPPPAIVIPADPFPARMANDPEVEQDIMDDVINVFPDIDPDWLRSRCGYPTRVILDYIVEHGNDVPRVRMNGRIHDVSMDSGPPTPKAAGNAPKLDPLEEFKRNELEKALLATLDLAAAPCDDRNDKKFVEYMSFSFSKVRVSVMRALLDIVGTPLRCFAFCKLLEMGSLDALETTQIYQSVCRATRLDNLLLKAVRPPKKYLPPVPVPEFARADWDRFLQMIQDVDNEADKLKKECMVCFDLFDEGNGLGCSGSAGDGDDDTHVFCLSCLKQQSAVLCTDGTLAPGGLGLKCMDPGCSKIIPWGSISVHLPRDVRRRLGKRLDEEAIMGIQEMERCKYCSFGAIIDAPPTEIKVFDCAKCKAQFCRNCKLDWNLHFGLKCAEAANENKENARRQLEEDMALAVIRRCHKCGLVFAKEDGCNKMTCRCGATQCYVCRAADIDYKHFCPHMRDPARPEECPRKCPLKCLLWTKGDVVDARALDEVKKKAAEDNDKREHLERLQ